MSVARTMPIIQARNALTSLPEQLGQDGAVAITRRGKPVMAVMSWDLYESIIETLEILGDEDMMAALRRGLREVAQGKTIPWEQAKRDLGL